MERYKGCILDPKDERDLYFAAEREALASLPPSIKLLPSPAILDQGKAGTCVLNASAVAYMDLMIAQGLFVGVPSRLFMRWITAEFEGDPMEDNGVCIRDTVKMFIQYGVCSEHEWPYDLSQIFVKPPDHCYYNAKKEKIIEYRRIVGEHNLKACLAEKYPVIIGIPLDEYFEGEEVAATGKMRAFDEKSFVGNHGVLLRGYDDTNDDEKWFVQNSWGEDWGQKGFFTLPQGYPMNDCWTLRKIG